LTLESSYKCVAGSFDSIDHGHLRSFLDLRIKDGVIRRMIDKWLKAGVLDRGTLTKSVAGTPQGGVISPLLANIFLHHVLDDWFVRVAKPRMKGRCQLVRYADDFVMSFEDHLDGRRMLAVLGKRLGRFGLTLHPSKTRYVDFRFKRPQGRHPATQATSFAFLGFTHVWGTSRKGKPVVRQITAKDRYARALHAVKDWCQQHLHLSLKAQHRRLSRMLQGHYAYYGITGNGRRLRWYLHQVERIWKASLSRRSRSGKLTWTRMEQVLNRYPLPPTRIVHQWSRA
jgi:RNA-directed DNA polymerase